MEPSPKNAPPQAVFNGKTYLLPLLAEWQDIDPADMAVIQERARQFRALYPMGEPMGKRKPPYRMHIKSNDIVAMFDVSIRKAQLMLQNTRFVREKNKNDLVTVKEFCAVNGFEEAEVRDFLNKLDEMEAQQAGNANNAGSAAG